MAVVYLDPTAEPGLPITPYELRAHLDGDGATIGLLANSFVDSAEFLDQLGGHLAALLPGVSFRAYDKTSPSRAAEPISAAEAAAIRNDCLAVITAYGH